MLHLSTAHLGPFSFLEPFLIPSKLYHWVSFVAVYRHFIVYYVPGHSKSGFSLLRATSTSYKILYHCVGMKIVISWSSAFILKGYCWWVGCIFRITLTYCRVWSWRRNQLLCSLQLTLITHLFHVARKMIKSLPCTIFLVT